ncbi:MAG TPA: DUF5676 family membrane protein [Candidatus Nanoarchaeia archaeon]|nr:DUF5676 family membrane protein [Candidatus Nanoarchaeia archaeon]
MREQKKRLNEAALGFSIAVVSAACMLLLGILAPMGMYMGASRMMAQWHMFYSLSLTGMIAGIIEGAIIGFVLGYAIAYLYNRFNN